MTKGKWLIMLVILLGLGLLLVGCGGDKEPAQEPAQEQEQAAEEPTNDPAEESTEKPAEEPKAEEEVKEVEEPQPEEPKAEEPKKEEPKVEEPKEEEPKEEPAPAEPSGPAALNVPHAGDAPYDSCANCHAGGKIFTNVELPASHGNLDGAFANCSSCHEVNFK